MSGGLGARLARASRLGAVSARTSAGWLAGAVIEGLGRSAAAGRLRRAAAARAAEGLGRLKGLAMKLGQVLSFAIDEVPAELRQALESLQTSSPPRPFTEIAPVLERALGRPLPEAFAHLEPVPIAAASIGQVHRGRLLDGTAVAVKVQYPDVAAAVRADLANLSLLVRFVRWLAPRVDAERLALELRERLREELDYVAEARHQAAFAARFERHPFIAVPRVIASHSAPEVLTSEYVEGRTFPSALAGAEGVRSRQGEIIFRFAYGCIFGKGTFDADPHPGNYLFDGDGSRVTFLDFGCVKRLPPPVLQAWRTFVRALLEGDRLASRRHALELGFVEPGPAASLDRIVDALTRLYLPFRADGPRPFPSLWAGVSLADMLGKELAEVRAHLRIPGDLVFANRTLAGMYMVLSRLGAIAPWRRIAREYVCGDPPATPLGTAERAWAERGARGA
ncbi:MAG TPA: AarF/ABC1/UbiB kinase family protein [Anaeromyxobacteraceae bacterium]|nr:AarF/ABC1/UbiB kinase family protein [Anaeromyxobacteraceae bacterium]